MSNIDLNPNAKSSEKNHKPSDYECPICLETNILDLVDLQCNPNTKHYLCKQCYIKYIKTYTLCPYCRSSIQNISKYDKYKAIFNKMFSVDNFVWFIFFLLTIIGNIVGFFIFYVIARYVFEFVCVYVINIINQIYYVLVAKIWLDIVRYD